MLDDDALQLQILDLLLQSQGITAQCFTSPALALAAIVATNKPVTLLMDLRMPFHDPVDYCATVRAASATTRLVGMSATMPAPSLTSLFDAFLLKPLEPAQLLPALCACEADAVGATPALNDGIFESFASKMPAPALDSLYAAYFSDAAKRLSQIESAITRNDVAGCREAAHALKGSSAMLGLQAVAVAVAPLEPAEGPLPAKANSMLLTTRAQVEQARLLLASRFESLPPSTYVPPLPVANVAPTQESKTP